MPWTVYNSDGKVLQSAEVGSNSITNAKMADDAIDSAEIVDGSVDLAHMSVNSIDSDQYVDGSIDLVHMSDNSVDSDQYVDASIDTAHIGNLQITNALMADDAVGVAELSATGTASSSTFLRGDNAWAAGGGDLVFIGTVEASNDATITVTGLDTAVYDHFEIQFAGITPISDNTVLQFRMGDSSGIDSGASDYAWAKIRSDESGSRGATSDTSDEMIEIAEGLGNQVTEGYSGTLYINTGDLSGHTLIYGTGATKIASETISLYLTYGMRLAALTLTQVQASIDIGNVSTGRMTVWGRKHA